MKTIKEMQAEVYEVNVANGWFDAERSFGDGIALLHSEVSEALEAYREHGIEDQTAEDFGPVLTVGEDSIGLYEEVTPVPPPKPEGVGSELADVLIRLLDEAQRQGVGVTHWRSDGVFKHSRGFGTMIAALHSSISEWYDTRSHGWAEIVYHNLLVIAVECGIDLDAEYERKIAFNKTRGHRHGGKRL